MQLKYQSTQQLVFIPCIIVLTSCKIIFSPKFFLDEDQFFDRTFEQLHKDQTKQDQMFQSMEQRQRSSDTKNMKKIQKINKVPPQVVTSVVDGLKLIYFTKLRQLEDVFKFGNFFAPLMSRGDFEAKPSVVLLGQYSTGKKGFTKQILIHVIFCPLYC